MGLSKVRSLNPAIRYASLLSLALPSILLQSGAPLAITFQTALLGRKATELVAVWAVVATATNAATVVFNFLVVGVTAKVTKVVAVGAWDQVGARIRLALGLALAMGCVACGMLMALEKPLTLLLNGTQEVLALARSYFLLRVIGVPPQLLVMCTSGILQGYKRVNLVAALQLCRVLLDVFASYVSLYILDLGLVGVGIGTILSSCFVATAGFTCILLLPPKEGRGKIHIFTPLCQQQWQKGEDGASSSVEEGLLKKGEQGEVEDKHLNEVLNEGMWKFVWDGLSTMLRSALVQASFFLVLAVASELGVHAVAAHQVLMQLWMINIYIADGFATAGTIVCSGIAGHMAKSKTAVEFESHLHDLRIASWRVLILGICAGVSLGVFYWTRAEFLMGLFTFDEATKEYLRSAWLFLSLVQPLNSIVFVYDGLIYAAQAFSYMAACLTFGFFILFIPTIALAHFYFKSLVAAWFAKGILNLVRFFVAGYRIHFQFLDPPPFEEALEQQPLIREADTCPIDVTSSELESGPQDVNPEVESCPEENNTCEENAAPALM